MTHIRTYNGIYPAQFCTFTYDIVNGKEFLKLTSFNHEEWFPVKHTFEGVLDELSTCLLKDFGEESNSIVHLPSVVKKGDKK